MLFWAKKFPRPQFYSDGQSVTMNQSDIITNIEIYGADSYGRGVGRYAGKVVFVPFAAKGDIVDCRIVSRYEKYDIAAIENIVEPSPYREAPPCPYFTICPGCAFQHISYDLELKLKGERIASCLSKFAGAKSDSVPVAPSKEIYGYRNHVTLHLWYNGAEPQCGLISPEERRVIPIDACLLLPEFAVDLPKRISDICRDLVGAYRGRFALRLPFVFDHEMKQVMLVPGRSPMRKVRRMMRLVLETLQDTYPAKSSLVRNVAGRRFRFSPLSFTQANESLMPILYEKVRQAVHRMPVGKILDLFSGVGVLGTICSGDDGVTFIERSPTAVEDLKHNAIANKLANATILEGDVETLLQEVISGEAFAWVIMNPPRKGLPPNVAGTVADSAVKNLVYVSCDPATLSRDINRLMQGGFKADTPQGAFKVETVEGVDMFPRTPHVETIAILLR